MKAERHYVAEADNGRDYFRFDFMSCHKANSRENKEDAAREYKRKHGYRPTILRAWLGR